MQGENITEAVPESAEETAEEAVLSSILIHARCHTPSQISGENPALPMLYLTISVATDEPRSLMGMMLSPSMTCNTDQQEAIGILH